MKRFSNATISMFFILTLALSACAPPANTTPPPAPATDSSPSALSATLSEITGKVETRQPDQDVFWPAQLNSFLNINGQALTGTDGRARLDLSTGTIIRVAPNSLFTLASNETSGSGLKTQIDLAIGKLFIILNGGSAEVETPTGTAAVRGSYMSVNYDADSGETRVTCLEGHCSLSNAFGSVEITAGQTAVIRGAGQPPQIGEMSEEDIQDWLDNNQEAELVVDELAVETVATNTPSPTPEPPNPIAPTLTPTPPVFDPPIIDTEPIEEPEPPDLVPTVAISSISPTSTVTGQPLTIIVHVGGVAGAPMPTGGVKVFADGEAFCDGSLNSDGFAECVGGIPRAGSFSLTARYLGDSNYVAASSAAQGHVVSKADTYINITDISHGSLSYLGDEVFFTATVDVFPPGAGAPFGSVTFSGGTGVTCTVDHAPWKCGIIFPSSGTFSITATYSGDDNFFNSLSSSVSHTVSP